MVHVAGAAWEVYCKWQVWHRRCGVCGRCGMGGVVYVTDVAWEVWCMWQVWHGRCGACGRCGMGGVTDNYFTDNNK